MFFIEVVAAIVNLMLGFLITKIGPLQLKYGQFHSWDCHSLCCLIVSVQNSRLVFGWETEEIWTCVPYKSCI